MKKYIMCKQSTIDKIDAGTHIVVPKKWTIFLGTISPLTLALGVLWFGGYMQRIEAHVLNETIHPHYEQSSKTFVPRSEVEYKFEDMNDKLDKIIDKLEIIE